ncbi:hypothetical protein I6G82_03335 [Lysinibacillus macroides]|uniref:hypothetical protein n=1 Tax=Lysinibacillus macroides TaxID=33935 RepID=UPI0013792AA8|nr:hypothetical protein [Lysinibacillus macroides]QPR68681.1 hypothetical protein I6G82_03335 [Lysinibacillus macroides]
MFEKLIHRKKCKFFSALSYEAVFFCVSLKKEWEVIKNWLNRSKGIESDQKRSQTAQKR